MKEKGQSHRISHPFMLFKQLSQNELKQFEKLINCGYFKNEKSIGSDIKNLIALIRSLKKHRKAQGFTESVKQAVYCDVFGEVNSDCSLNHLQKKDLSKMMNKLLLTAEKFLMFEKIKNTTEYDAVLLYPQLIKRKHFLLLKRKINAAEKGLEKETKRGVQYHTQRFEIERIKEEQSHTDGNFAKLDNYDDLQRHIDTKYLLQKLQYHLAKITLINTQNKAFYLEPYKKLKDLLTIEEYEENSLIKLYLLNIQLIEENNKNKNEMFLKLFKLLEEEENSIPENFLKPFLTNLANYCSFQINNKGDLNYFKYQFEILKAMDNAKLLVKNEGINIGLLKNIITVACRRNEFNWARKKLMEYEKYIPKKVRKSVLAYNNLIIDFNQKKFNKVVDYFRKRGRGEIEKIDDKHEISARIIELQYHFEKDIIAENNTYCKIASLTAKINEYKKTKPHRKLIKRRKDSYLNFIRIFRRIYNLKNPDCEANISKVKDSFEEKDSIWEKQWLLDKINELENMSI